MTEMIRVNRDEEAVLKLAELIMRNDEYDPWLETIDNEEALNALKEEISELESALGDGDREKILDEVGDVLWTVYIALSVLKRTLGVDYRAIVERIEDKMRRRKPYIFDGKKVSLEEARRMWRKAKDEERTPEDSR